MGWMDRVRKAISSGGGAVGVAPSEQFPSSLGLIHAALVRFDGSRARNGGWVTVTIRDSTGKQIGIMQYAGDGLINLCDRDDIDLRALLRSAGREELAERCDERDSAMFAIEGATREDVAYALELVILAEMESKGDLVVEASIEA